MTADGHPDMSRDTPTTSTVGIVNETPQPAAGKPTNAAAAARLLTTAELAAFLQLDPERVYELRQRGTGPAYVKIGRDVRYTWHDVRAWLAANTRTSTSAAA